MSVESFFKGLIDRFDDWQAQKLLEMQARNRVRRDQLRAEIDKRNADLRELSSTNLHMVVEIRRLRRGRLEEQAISTIDGDMVTNAPKDVRPAAPPMLAEALIRAFVKRNFHDAILGDLQEDFASNLRQYGSRRAHLMYWIETARSMAPLLKRAGFWGLFAVLMKKWTIS